MSGLKRFHDWDRRLADYLQVESCTPFAWGRHDCVLFALGAAAALTGEALDLVALRGSYDSAIGAARRMRALFGAADLEASCEAFRLRHGGEEVTPTLAQRGDLVLADITLPGGGTSPALGVVGLDGQFAVFVGPDGYVRLKLRQCRKAWRVG